MINLGTELINREDMIKLEDVGVNVLPKACSLKIKITQ